MLSDMAFARCASSYHPALTICLSDVKRTAHAHRVSCRIIAVAGQRRYAGRDRSKAKSLQDLVSLASCLPSSSPGLKVQYNY